jgi:hypothetical protein
MDSLDVTALTCRPLIGTLGVFIEDPGGARLLSGEARLLSAPKARHLSRSPETRQLGKTSLTSCHWLY